MVNELHVNKLSFNDTVSNYDIGLGVGAGLLASGMISGAMSAIKIAKPAHMLMYHAVYTVAVGSAMSVYAMSKISKIDFCNNSISKS